MAANSIPQWIVVVSVLLILQECLLPTPMVIDRYGDMHLILKTAFITAWLGNNIASLACEQPTRTNP